MALANDLIGLPPPARPLILEGALEDEEESGAVDRLGQDLIGSVRERGDSALEVVGLGEQEKDRRRGRSWSSTAARSPTI